MRAEGLVARTYSWMFKHAFLPIEVVKEGGTSLALQNSQARRETAMGQTSVFKCSRRCSVGSGEIPEQERMSLG